MPVHRTSPCITPCLIRSATFFLLNLWCFFTCTCSYLNILPISMIVSYLNWKNPISRQIYDWLFMGRDCTLIVMIKIKLLVRWVTFFARCIPYSSKLVSPCNTLIELFNAWSFCVSVFIHAIKVELRLACVNTASIGDRLYASTSQHRVKLIMCSVDAQWLFCSWIILKIWTKYTYSAVSVFVTKFVTVVAFVFLTTDYGGFWV